jgi:hypothetical protein
MSRRRRTPGRSRGRPAFALPVVVLLATVATLVSLMLLERHANAHLATQRQIESYYEHHARLGIKEMLDQWLLTTGGNVSDRLLDGGLAFEVALANGRTVRVWLEDGQGSLLRHPSGTGPTFETARAAAQLVALATGEGSLDERGPARDARKQERDRKNDLEDFDRPKLRDGGPLAVSALSADYEVLVAIAEAAGAGETSAMIAGDIVSQREDGPLTLGDIGKICDHPGLTHKTKLAIAQLLTTTPTLWRIVAESDEGRWTGLVEQAARGSGMAGSGSSTLLEWERIDEDPGAP